MTDTDTPEYKPFDDLRALRLAAAKIRTGGEARQQLIERLVRHKVPTRQIAEAAGMTHPGVLKIVRRIERGDEPTTRLG